MIFATVGTQLPFPRLLDALDALAGTLGLTVVAQTCEPERTGRHILCHAQLPPGEFDRLLKEAELVIGHAGVGTILSVRKNARTAILVPRRAALGEHRNDHQMATARVVEGLPGFSIAWETEDLERLIAAGDRTPAHIAPSAERDRLIARIRSFVLER